MAEKEEEKVDKEFIVANIKDSADFATVTRILRINWEGIDRVMEGSEEPSLQDIFNSMLTRNKFKAISIHIKKKDGKVDSYHYDESKWYDKDDNYTGDVVECSKFIEDALAEE